jgi:ATP-dependent helicase/nuclease subunit A
MKNFTPEQLGVINASHKNLLVSASAGSGKTTVMAERIAQLIKNGADADEILVLTFTNAAAADIAARLEIENVGTFHKFCADLCQTYFAQIGLNPAFSILDEGGAAEIQNEILNTLINEYADKTPNAITAFCTVTGAKNLFEIIKSVSNYLTHSTLGNAPPMDAICAHYNALGAWLSGKFSPESDRFRWSNVLKTVRNYADLHRISCDFVRISPLKTTNPCHEYKEILNDLLKKIRTDFALPEEQILKNQSADKTLVGEILTLVNEYNSRFLCAKTARNYMDFADLEAAARTILTDFDTKTRVQDKFKYIFVDEFQDTNPIQDEILSAICAPHTQIFAVGDIKQSIYGFRGTTSSIFQNRLKSADASVHYLNANFRSNAAILSFINRVFCPIMRESTAGLDYEKTSKLVSNLTGGEVEVLNIENGKPEHEAAVIAQKIWEITRENGANFGEIAILARNSTHFDTLIETFNACKIPCATDKKQSMFDIPEIMLLNNFLFAINDETDATARFVLMKSFVYNFTDDEILHIKKEIFDNELRAKYGGFIEDLVTFSALAKLKNGVEVLTNWISRAIIIPRLNATPDGHRRVKNIYNFLNKLKNHSAQDTVAEYCHAVKNCALDIEIDISAENAVHILTIHGAKGLEFDTVFLYNAGANFSSADRRRSVIPDKTLGLCVYSHADGFEKRQSLGRLASVILQNKEQIAEEMRLLYVALTRAKSRLFIVGSGKEYEQKASLDDQEIMLSRSYFDFIRPAETIPADEIPVINPKPEQRILGVKPNKSTVEKHKKRFEFKYPHAASIDAEIKTSVTVLTAGAGVGGIDFKSCASASHGNACALASGRNSFEMNTPESPQEDGTEYGTRFHKAMQMGEAFDAAGEKCLEIVGELTRGMAVYKELVVMSEIEKNGEKLMVQGVIDLLAVGKNRAIVVDYKTNNLGAERLKEVYSGQICMYKTIVERALKIPVEAYLYSSKLGIIIVPNFGSDPS